MLRQLISGAQDASLLRCSDASESGLMGSDLRVCHCLDSGTELTQTDKNTTHLKCESGDRSNKYLKEIIK